MPYKTQRTIEFHHTDEAGICHFSTFFLLMESVEHEFLRSLGTSAITYREGNKIGFPRLSAACDYFNPVRFEDAVDVTLRIDRLGTKSITYGFTFSHQGKLVARGRIAAVCCISDPGKPLEPIAIPGDFAAKIASVEEPSDAESD